MTDAPERTLVLLPDDEDWLSLFMGMEEPLLTQLALNSRAVQAGDEEVWELPQDLDGVGAHEAWGRLFQALPEPLRHTGRNIGRYEPNQERPTGRYTLYAPDSRWEHTPLYPADVDPRDVAAVAAVLAHFRTALDGTDHTELADFLQQMADDWADPGREGNAKRMVEDFTRGLSVWQLPHQPDTAVLLAAVAGPGGETPERIVLTPPQEDAYQTFTRRVSAAVAGNSPHDYVLHHYANS
ncbi:hypothetical protein K388_07128 [Streptomyces sp. KhCrAH-43]|uniref:hypothetical protein n=1 Tax=unclassified Streptomyces TaxID=2593676 RepID=UPI00036D2B29|nr:MULTISPECIES: hypothetical protein [unclassified Streptomyces]MYS36346.1 hypothetical protein [Streptomyces sp. SID4920]MYX64001.1 hypothetical protein [Streptomyces sp. SID8373]RAJ47851.1 hypothetical protein K388_07128 [Streptomyces sp. KhCrAH-43]